MHNNISVLLILDWKKNTPVKVKVLFMHCLLPVQSGQPMLQSHHFNGTVDSRYLELEGAL